MKAFFRRDVWYVAALRCVIGAMVSTGLFLLAQGLFLIPWGIWSPLLGIPVGILTGMILYRGGNVRYFPKLILHFVCACLLYALCSRPFGALMVRLFYPAAYAGGGLHLSAGTGMALLVFWISFAFMYLMSLWFCRLVVLAEKAPAEEL